MTTELRQRNPQKQQPAPQKTQIIEEPVAEIALSGACQAAIAIILVLVAATLIFTIMIYVETRALRHDLLEPPTNSSALRAAHSAMEVATQVFRRKKQFMIQ